METKKSIRLELLILIPIFAICIFITTTNCSKSNPSDQTSIFTLKDGEYTEQDICNHLDTAIIDHLRTEYNPQITNYTINNYTRLSSTDSILAFRINITCSSFTSKDVICITSVPKIKSTNGQQVTKTYSCLGSCTGGCGAMVWTLGQTPECAPCSGTGTCTMVLTQITYNWEK